MDAEKVAKWFIQKNPYLTNGYMDSNIILNKLLYFSNLFGYAVLNERVIDDVFIAFPKGPVVYSIYRDYRYNGLNAYPKNAIELDQKYLKLFEVVNFMFDYVENDKLIYLTHVKHFWQDVKDRIPSNPPIIFENADSNLLQKCRDIYSDMCEFIDFKKLRKDVIACNTYYYDTDNIKELTDEIINELLKEPKCHKARIIEIIDGEINLYEMF